MLEMSIAGGRSPPPRTRQYLEINWKILLLIEEILSKNERNEQS